MAGLAKLHTVRYSLLLFSASSFFFFFFFFVSYCKSVEGEVEADESMSYDLKKNLFLPPSLYQFSL